MTDFRDMAWLEEYYRTNSPGADAAAIDPRIRFRTAEQSLT